MRIARKLRSRPEASTPVAALLAVLALLVQAFMPAAAMAAQGRAADETVIVCTQMGVQVLKLGQDEAPKGGFAGLPCADCLAAAAAVAPPALARVARPVAYAVARVEHPPTAEPTLRGARAPPRPPGQGPPAPNA